MRTYHSLTGLEPSDGEPLTLPSVLQAVAAIVVTSAAVWAIVHIILAAGCGR